MIECMSYSTNIMVITHHGGQCFKVTLGGLTVVFDPPAKGSAIPPARFGADIVLISRHHKDMDGAKEVAYGEKQPFIIDGPGEYEHTGITVQGFQTKSSYGLSAKQEDAVNTIYAVQLDGMRIVHLGALSDKEFPAPVREAVDGIDVLFVPIGGDGVLDAAAAYQLAVALSPHIIIPMHWSGIGAEGSLELFLKEGDGATETIDKLTLKKKDTLERDGAIIVVTP